MDPCAKHADRWIDFSVYGHVHAKNSSAHNTIAETSFTFWGSPFNTLSGIARTLSKGPGITSIEDAPMSVEVLHDPSGGDAEDGSIVDIVAIHGLQEGPKETWTEPSNGKNWLKDFLPIAQGGLLKARILSYGYEIDILASFDNDAANGITSLAQTMVSRLQAERGLTGASRRPIIFVCHDFGGIILKRALAFSATQVSNKVAHNYSIYISTYGILFLGTPHQGYDFEYVQDIMRKSKHSSALDAVMVGHQELMQNVADQFAPLVKQYHIFFIWEQLQTHFKRISGFVVNHYSAAPLLDNTERSQSSTDHSRLCKFNSEECPEYRTILEALMRYSRSAQTVIAGRWTQAKKFLYTQRSIEASELVGFDVHNENRPYVYLNTPQTPQGEFEGVQNKYFYVPHNVSIFYTGQARLYFELQQKMLRPQWSTSPPRRRIVVIYGLGGSGKTQFCLKFAQEHYKNFWAVFWVDASSVETAESALSAIGKLGGLGESHQAGVYWLAQLKLPWLLVIDNADDPKVDYSRFFPGGDWGHIIITSRLHDCKVYATVGSYEFRNMDEEDAILLLLKTSGEDTEAEGTRRAAKTIVKALGYLPLAITQAGASIKQDVCSLENYLERYEEHRSELMKRKVVQNSDSYHHSIFATYEITVQRLKSEDSRDSTDAMEILQVLAFLHFQRIPASMFEKAWENTKRWPEVMPPKTAAMKFSEFLGYRAGEETGKPSPYLSYLIDTQSRLPGMLCESRRKWNDYRFREAVRVLENHSLVYRDCGEEVTFSMHPIVQAWARDRLPGKDRRNWSDIAANTLSASIAPNLDPTSKPYRISLVPHINANMKGESACTILQGRTTKFQVQKATQFASVYSEAGYWKEASRLQQLIIDAYKHGGPHSVPALLDVTMGLAHSCWNLDEVVRSLQLLSSVVKQSEGSLGEDDIRTLRAKDKLAETLWLIGKRQEARKLSEDAVEKLKHILGPTHPYTLDAMDNLGRTYLHLGRASEAKQLHYKVLDSRDRMLGLSHPDTLMTMQNLGMSFHALKDLDQAEGLLDVVFFERSRVLGDEHAYTLWAINDLAKIRCDQGRPEEAEAMLTGILEIVTRTLGNEHIGMCMTKQNLIRAYNAQQRWTDALATTTELTAIQSKKMPPEHPDRIVSAGELAKITKHLGRLDEAQGMFIKVVELSTKVHGLEDYRTQNALGQLSAVYIAQGKFEEAAALDMEIGRISRSASENITRSPSTP